MISVSNVSDGHGEIDALVAQDALDESYFFFSKWAGCGSGREHHALSVRPVPPQKLFRARPPNFWAGPWLLLFGVTF